MQRRSGSITPRIVCRCIDIIISMIFQSGRATYFSVTVSATAGFLAIVVDGALWRAISRWPALASSDGDGDAGNADVRSIGAMIRRPNLAAWWRRRNEVICHC